MYANGQMPPGFPTPPGGGGMPGYRPGAGSGVPTPAPKTLDQDLPPDLKSDYDQAKEQKDLAAGEFKKKNYDGATEKYYNVLNIVRSNGALKTSAAGIEIETQARLNIALCKLNQKEFDVAIDQCERVLEKDSNNSKASFRLASALYEKTEKCTKSGT